MDKKIDDTSGATEATAPSARAHHAGDGGAVAGPARRLSAKRKLVAVQRLMRGESLEAVSRDLNVPVHRLDEYINAQREATGFDLRYNATAEPSDRDWRECTEVLSRRDFAELMRNGWT